MTKETPIPSHELALAVLESAAKEGTLSEAHKARLAELAGQSVRSNVTETLAASSGVSAAKAPAVIIAQPREVKELVESLKLEEGYAEAMETHKFFRLLKTRENAPDFGQVLKAFTPEMLVAAQDFQEPTLELTTKGRSFNELVAAIDSHREKLNGRIIPYVDNPRRLNPTYVDDLFKRRTTQKPEHWGAYIVEGRKEMDLHDFDDIKLTLKERLKRFADYKKATGVQGMDRLKYAHVMMQKLKYGEPIDAKSWTVLDEDPALSDSRVPRAQWVPGGSAHVRFRWFRPERQRDNGRFRCSVGGDVPNT